MANPPPMLPGLGFPVDSKIDLLRKFGWNSWIMGGTSSFQPEDIPGLGLDLDASYGVLNSIGPDVPATNGQAVRRWLDKSGNGRDFDQSTATNQPIFEAGGFNGRDCVSLDGTNDYLTMISGLDLLNNVPGATCCYVINTVIPPATRAVFAISVGMSSGVRVIAQTLSTGSFSISGRRTDSDALQSLILGSIDTSVGNILTEVMDYAGEKMTGYLQGKFEGERNPFQDAGNTSPTNSQAVSLGCLSNLTQQFINAKISRVLVWPRALTDEELGKVHAYLSQTYGIPLAS